METTLVLIKPGGVQRNLIGEICRRIEARDLKIVGLKLMNAQRSTVEEHYGEHVGKPFFNSVVDYLSSGPIVAIAVAFDSVNGEFNRRTISRILAQPIYRDALLFGKFLAGLATLGVFRTTAQEASQEAATLHGLVEMLSARCAALAAQIDRFEVEDADGPGGDR